VLIIESISNDVGRELAEQIVSEVGHAAFPLVVGVSTARGSGLRQAYEEAVEAADIGARLNSAPVVCHWTLGLLDWLYRLPPEAMSGNVYLAKVRTLAEHDAKANSDLVKTLEAYLEYGGALAEAAAAINVHRNTLLYRLGRIESITGVDLKDAGQRLNLHVALKGYRLLK